jgi:hypothetical protein
MASFWIGQYPGRNRLATFLAAFARYRQVAVILFSPAFSLNTCPYAATRQGYSSAHFKGTRDAKSSTLQAPHKVYNKYISDEEPIMGNLLLKFKLKDSPYGVTRETLKALADEMDVSETMVVHLAISRFAKEVLPAYEADDGQLTAGDIGRIRKAAKPMLPKGKVINTRSLL